MRVSQIKGSTLFERRARTQQNGVVGGRHGFKMPVPLTSDTIYGYDSAAMRVVGGQYRSRPLRSLPGMDVRPTSDRLRETLFDVLTAGNPSALEGKVWFDLYAGTGAVGIEALSRGASKVYFVESSAEAAELVRRNLSSLKIETSCQILQVNVARALTDLQAKGESGDFFFLDPPYRMTDAYEKTLQLLSEAQLLRVGGIVIAEHQKKFDPGESFGSLRRYRKLEQGEAVLSFYRKEVTSVA